MWGMAFQVEVGRCSENLKQGAQGGLQREGRCGPWRVWAGTPKPTQ